jgi:hypothetical protein
VILAFNRPQNVAPLRKVRKQDPFALLEEHFQILWRTCNTDLFHMAAQIEDGLRLTADMFNRRQSWFQHVLDTLRNIDRHDSKNSDGLTPEDRRKYPRQPCDSSPGTLGIKWDHNGTPRVDPAEIIDCSYSGMRIKIKSDLFPQCGKNISLENAAIESPRTAFFKIEDLITRSRNRFEIVRVEDGKSIIGVRVPDSEISPGWSTNGIASSLLTENASETRRDGV